MGRRRQLFSPSPERKGSNKSTPIPMTGAISKNGVSSCGGSKESRAYNHRKKKSGRGTVWIIVGSGWPVGPKGPRMTAQKATASRMQPAKIRSFQIASGTKGTPSL